MNNARLLNWKDRKHWGGRGLPCVHCRNLTPLRDDNGRPSHKVCAEAAEVAR